MKTSLRLILALFIVGVSFSFTSNPALDFTGTYGVSESDMSQIKLQLNPDMTFEYQDFSDSQNKIKVAGNWTANKNVVELHSSDLSPDFHDKWKVEKDGNAVKARKGLSFYRLCKKV